MAKRTRWRAKIRQRRQMRDALTLCDEFDRRLGVVRRLLALRRANGAQPTDWGQIFYDYGDRSWWINYEHLRSVYLTKGDLKSSWVMDDCWLLHAGVLIDRIVQRGY